MLLQIDAFGNQIKFWAWPIGTPMPTDPLFSVVDNAHDSGTIAMFAGSEDFGSGDQLPAVAAFRYVLVADEHIPEPTTLLLSLLGLTAVGISRRRNSKT